MSLPENETRQRKADFLEARVMARWEERRDGWHRDGYTITIHGPHGRYAALAPDGTTIRLGLRTFVRAVSYVNLHREEES